MSDNVIKGIVEVVSSRPWEDPKTGNEITLWSLKLEGSKKWYRNGTDSISAATGDYVKFVLNPKGYIEKGSIEVVTPAAERSNPAPSPASAKARTHGQASESVASAAKVGGVSKDGYWANKEARDVERDERFKAVSEPRMALSVATEAASRVVVAALQTDALGFGTTAKGKRLPMIQEYVKEVATDLALFIQDAPEVLAGARGAASAGEDSSVGGLDDDDE